MEASTKMKYPIVLSFLEKELEIISYTCSCFPNLPKTNPLLRQWLIIATCTSGSWHWHTVLVMGFLVMHKNSWGNVNWNTSKLS